MPPVDPNALFARAEQAFLAGQVDAARRDLIEVERAAGDHPAVLHLLALVEKKRGDSAAAARAFVRAHALAPGDAQIAGNYANLLGATGKTEDALALYGKALALRPDFGDARYNRALLLERIGRLPEALADLEALGVSSRGDARIHSARGSVLRKLKRLDEAAEAYDAALLADPDRVLALHGRGRTAVERGEAGASAYYARAIGHTPEDPELVLGLAEALEAEGDPEGMAFLAEAVARRPDWVVGHEVLARMRSEAGEIDGFVDHFHVSLSGNPADRALHLAHWQSLARAQKNDEALVALRSARAAIGNDAAVALIEAVLTSESGDPQAGLALLDALDDADPQVCFARGRMALRAGDAERAAGVLEAFVKDDSASINGWAHLDLAWRLIGDPRHQWLSGQSGLFGSSDLGLAGSELDELATLLRTLHVTRAHPIGQSLRGGTQTRGRLFDRREPQLLRLHDALITAVNEHMDALPAFDQSHPLLRHRGASVAIGGAWSVRLGGGGFHVNHVHPEGILSSACYISLPEMIESDPHGGWLELGRPPAELGLALEPLAVIEPRPGRLALFPSYLFHGTRPFSKGERLTVAFDVASQ